MSITQQISGLQLQKHLKRFVVRQAIGVRQTVCVADGTCCKAQYERTGPASMPTTLKLCLINQLTMQKTM